MDRDRGRERDREREKMLSCPHGYLENAKVVVDLDPDGPHGIKRSKALVGSVTIALNAPL